MSEEDDKQSESELQERPRPVVRRGRRRIKPPSEDTYRRGMPPIRRAELFYCETGGRQFRASKGCSTAGLVSVGAFRGFVDRYLVNDFSLVEPVRQGRRVTYVWTEAAHDRWADDTEAVITRERLARQNPAPLPYQPRMPTLERARSFYHETNGEAFRAGATESTAGLTSPISFRSFVNQSLVENLGYVEKIREGRAVYYTWTEKAHNQWGEELRQFPDAMSHEREKVAKKREQEARKLKEQQARQAPATIHDVSEPVMAAPEDVEASYLTGSLLTSADDLRKAIEDNGDDAVAALLMENQQLRLRADTARGQLTQREAERCLELLRGLERGLKIEVLHRALSILGEQG